MRRFYKNVLACILLAAITLGVMATWGWVRFGSVKAALLYTGGVRLIADPTTGSVGDLAPRARATAKLRLVNLSDFPITILGSKSSCTCMLVGDLPKSIPARGRGEVEVAYRAGAFPGKIQQSVVLLTDNTTSPQVSIPITGRIVAGSESVRSLDP